MVSGQMISVLISAVNIILPLSSQYREINAFVPTYQRRSTAVSTFGRTRRTVPFILSYADTPDDSLSEMKASGMKKELESYGISTKSMFDRKEFEIALKEARLNDLKERKSKMTSENDKKVATSSNASKKEKTSIWGKTKSGDDKLNATREKWSSRWKNMASTAKEVLDSHTKKSSDNSSSKKEPSSSSPTKKTRQQRYELALEEGAAMKLSSLKKELKDRGISTRSFFEKSDLIDAYANAIADNIESKSSTKSANTSRSSNEIFDPSYKNVIMHSFDPSSILSGDAVIDITAETAN